VDIVVFEYLGKTLDVVIVNGHDGRPDLSLERRVRLLARLDPLGTADRRSREKYLS
jgi:hypothetical protein